MLRVDLGRLDREGPIVVETAVSAKDDLWDDPQLEWTGDVAVHLTVTWAGTGEIVARGSVRGELQQQCRRCLQPVLKGFFENLTLVFSSEQENKDNGTAYAFEPTDAELDMSLAVREEVLLAMNPYVVCTPECKGFCSTCGANLNEVVCDCTEDEIDPRWAALRNLKDE